MDANKILKSDWLDLLFDGRNKAYGAYQLRRTYTKRVVTALLVVVALLLVVFGSSAIINGTKKHKNQVLVTDVKLSNVNIPKPPPEPKKPEPKPAPTKKNPDPIKLEVKKVTPPKIVPDNVYKEENKVKKVEEIVDTKIGTFDQKGLKTDVVAPPVKVEGPGGSGFGRPDVGEGTGQGKGEDDNKEYTNVQKEAQYPGGPGAWKNYLTRSLRSDVPTENGAPSGRNYTVIVSFLVGKDGVVSQVKAENDPGYGTAQEAVRVIQRSGKWTPAVQNGRNVVYRQRQQITFQVTEE
ncbi:MAG: energy transducer TonB [Chitinophagaceae bacterium]